MNELINFLEKLPDEKWGIKVNNNWNIKDVVAHLIGWNIEARKVIKETWESGDKPWFLEAKSFDNFNKQNTEHYRNLNPKELLAGLKKTDDALGKEIERHGVENLKAKPIFFWLFEEGEEQHSIQHLYQIKKSLN